MSARVSQISQIAQPGHTEQSAASRGASAAAMDPLSDVISLLKPKNYAAGGFDIGGDISVSFGRHQGVKCYAVSAGQGWLEMDGIAEPVRVETGDCFLLPHGRPFRLATDLALAPVDVWDVLATTTRRGGISLVNGGGGCCIVGGFFAFSGEHAGILLGMLPPIVHLRSDADKAAMRWSLDRMREELLTQQPGGSLLAQYLASMMMVQALRLHLAEGLEGGVGWLFALADKQMSAALRALHADPGRRWTLEHLAACAGMSRSTFALKFKQTVGTSPMEYLTRWRMLLAADRLVTTDEPVSAIALGLGYESESAFSTAFKRVMGCSPRQHGRGRGGVRAMPAAVGADPAIMLKALAS